MDTGFEEAPTVIDVRDEQFDLLPPPLPVRLTKRKPDQERWLNRLPDASSEVLRKARRRAPDWNLIGRISGAVARPVSD